MRLSFPSTLKLRRKTRSATITGTKSVTNRSSVNGSANTPSRRTFLQLARRTLWRTISQTFDFEATFTLYISQCLLKKKLKKLIKSKPKAKKKLFLFCLTK